MHSDRCSKCEHLKALHLPGTGCTELGCACDRAGIPAELYHGAEGNKFVAGNPGPPRGNLRKRGSIKRLLNRLAQDHEEELFDACKKLALKIDDEKVQAQFIRFMTEQLDGRPVESIRLTGADDGPVATYDLSCLDAEDLRTVLALLKGATRDDAGDDAQSGQS